MGALDSLTATPFSTGSADAATPLDGLTSTTPKAPIAPTNTPTGTATPSTPSSLGMLTGSPYKPPVAPSSKDSGPHYFQGPDKDTGAFLGISNEKDVSGKPYFAYRNPGDTGTTTDKTRVATTFDPRVPQKLSMDMLHNGRMPESISSGIKNSLGGNYSDELDHSIALELSGSNDKSNLRIEPGRTNGGKSATFDSEENALAQKVTSGQMSLFDAQHQIAVDKNKAGDANPIPWVDKSTAEAAHDTLNAPSKSPLGLLKGIASTVANTLEHPVGNILYKVFPGIKEIVGGIKTGNWQPYLDALHKELNLPPLLTMDPSTGKPVINKDSAQRLSNMIIGFVGPGADAENIVKEVTEGALTSGKDLPETAISLGQKTQELGQDAQVHPELPKDPLENGGSETESPKENPQGSSLDSSIAKYNGGVEPPVNKGGLRAPVIDWTSGEDKAAIRLSTDTMERNLEKIFPKQTAAKINTFLVDAVRNNETDRVKFLNKVRGDVKQTIVGNLGIHAGTKESVLVQRFGEGRMSLDELKQASPQKWQQIQKASEHIRGLYDQLLNRWNVARVEHGLKPVTKRENYFRHFSDISEFEKMFGFNFPDGELPTAISGITEFFKSQTPWASAAMRRFNGPFTEDAIGGLDNYLDTTSRAIFHTDSVQRGRLIEKYLRNAAAAQPEIKLPNFASNLNDWVNLVSGKQAKLDRAVESVVGRNTLAFLRNFTRRFGVNVIGGNVSAAVTHLIPTVYTLATTDTKSAVMGAMDTLRAPFLGDFRQVGGTESKFLTRRFGSTEIEKTTGEKIAHTISKPFQWADEFISRFTVAAKYSEGISKGLSARDAMQEADNYANRVIGDRSIGNLPNLMNTKTLGAITQFQIEVNDNLHVLAHDIPRWAGDDIKKIGLAFSKFAVYSYLFNQLMQNIKGSGKGLDPIDLGLTLAGLNDEGRGETFSQRLGLTATDLAKELPFASIPTGGQIPAFQPLQQGATALYSGDLKTFLQKLATSYLSPVGGGVQAQKTYSGITAYLNGYATDSTGKITGFVKPTPGNFFKGTLFGSAAFDQVKQTNTETKKIQGLLKQQQADSKAKDAQATTLAQQLMDVSKSQGSSVASDQFTQLAAKDPDMASRVAKAVKNIQNGITKEDTMIKQLGVKDGQRARYLKSRLDALKTADEKNTYWNELVAKKLVNNQILQQIKSMQ